MLRDMFAISPRDLTRLAIFSMSKFCRPRRMSSFEALTRSGIARVPKSGNMGWPGGVGARTAQVEEMASQVGSGMEHNGQGKEREVVDETVDESQ